MIIAYHSVLIMVKEKFFFHVSVSTEVTEVTEQNTEDQTFAKQQLGSAEGGGGTMIGLKWCKQRDIVSIAVPFEKVESTKKEC